MTKFNGAYWQIVLTFVTVMIYYYSILFSNPQFLLMHRWNGRRGIRMMLINTL